MAPQTRAGGRRNNKKFASKNTKSTSPQPYGKAFSKPIVKPGLRIAKKNQSVLHDEYDYGDMVRNRSKDNLSNVFYKLHVCSVSLIKLGTRYFYVLFGVKIKS